MSITWPPLTYESWSATCDTVHAHTQLLGKLAVQLAPPEPQLQHAALRLTARGWETLARPAPDVVVVMSRSFAGEIAQHVRKAAPQAAILLYTDLLARARARAAA